MAAHSSVLAYLATRFATHPENLATEALNFVIASSASARGALIDLCRQVSDQQLGDLTFSTQRTYEDGSRPDLVGRAIDGCEPVVIEAKFWAGLTSNQPVAYLAALPENGLLLFVAPEERAQTLWAELLRRTGSATAAGAGGVRWRDTRAIRLGSRTLALVSWRTLLAHMKEASERVGEAVTADIHQLAALCDKMDSDAFLPLRSEELTSNLGRRMQQFCDLADDLTNLLVARKFADVRRLRAAAGKGWSGRYLRFRGHGALLYCDARRWSEHGQSPLWLAVYGREFDPCTVEPDQLRTAGIDFHMTDGHCNVALLLPTDVERDTVIDETYGQILRVIAAVSDLGDTVGSPPPDTGFDAAPA